MTLVSLVVALQRELVRDPLQNFLWRERYSVQAGTQRNAGEHHEGNDRRDQNETNQTQTTLVLKLQVPFIGSSVTNYCMPRNTRLRQTEKRRPSWNQIKTPAAQDDCRGTKPQ